MPPLLARDTTNCRPGYKKKLPVFGISLSNGLGRFVEEFSVLAAQMGARTHFRVTQHPTPFIERI